MNIILNQFKTISLAAKIIFSSQKINNMVCNFTSQFLFLFSQQ